MLDDGRPMSWQSYGCVVLLNHQSLDVIRTYLIHVHTCAVPVAAQAKTTARKTTPTSTRARGRQLRRAIRHMAM